VVILLVPSSIFCILYLQWQYVFKAPEKQVAPAPVPIVVEGPKRDLKALLHPEHHVSRDPGVRTFSWNITKAKLTPNGVEKEVFLINGMLKWLQSAACYGDFV
jgi:hypothetical protein